MGVDSGDIDRGDHTPRSVTHRRANSAHATLEKRLAYAVTADAISGEQVLQFGKRTRRLRSRLRQFAFREEPAQFIVAHVEQKHPAHDRRVGGKARADLHIACDRAKRCDARNVNDVATVTHRKMRGEAGSIAQSLQRGLSNLGQIERRKIREASIEQAGPRRNVARPRRAERSRALQRHEDAKNGGARQSESSADVRGGQRWPFTREQREHVKTMGERGHDIAFARIAGLILQRVIIHAASRNLLWRR